jgi:hypothetical protein
VVPENSNKTSASTEKRGYSRQIGAKEALKQEREGLRQQEEAIAAEVEKREAAEKCGPRN